MKRVLSWAAMDEPKGKGKDEPKGKGKDMPKGKDEGKGKDEPKGNGKDEGKGNGEPKGKGKDEPKGKGKDEEDRVCGCGMIHSKVDDKFGWPDTFVMEGKRWACTGARPLTRAERDEVRRQHPWIYEL